MTDQNRTAPEEAPQSSNCLATLQRDLGIALGGRIHDGSPDLSDPGTLHDLALLAWAHGARFSKTPEGLYVAESTTIKMRAESAPIVIARFLIQAVSE